MRTALLLALALAGRASAQECVKCWSSACPGLAAKGSLPRCPEPPAAAVKERSGRISVTTEPPARMSIDGKPAGNTPVKDLSLPSGKHRLHFEADGCEPLDATLELGPKETRTERFFLRSQGSPENKGDSHDEHHGAPPARVSPEVQKLVGHWRETWGKPGETDVSYHDEYDVVPEGSGVHVRSKKYEARNESLEDGTLRFELQSDFRIDYRLKLDPDGVLRGTAETPRKQVPITWERVR